MIQAVMFFALGVLTAGLIALAVTPAVWRRAMRLARIRAEVGIPMSRAEISADKDRLRADFATTNRKLEMDTSRLGDRITGQIVDINRKQDLIAGLRTEKQHQSETIADLEKGVDDLTTNLGDTDAKLATATTDLGQSESRLAKTSGNLSKLQIQFSEIQQVSEAQRLELVAHKTEIGNLKDSVAAAEAEIAKAADDNGVLAREAAAERARLAEAEERAGELDAIVTRLTAQRVAHLAELDRKAGVLRATEIEMAAQNIDHQTLGLRVHQLMGVGEDLAAELRLVSDDRAARAEEVAKRSAEVATISSDLEVERDRVAKAERDIAELRSARKALDRELKAALADGSEQFLAIGELRSALDEQQKDRAGLLDAMASLETRRDELQAELTATTEKRTEGQRELETLRDALGTEQTKREKAVENAAAERASSSEVEEVLAKRTEELDALNAELFAAVGKEQEIEARMVAAETALADSRTEAAAASIRQRTDAFTGGDNVRKALAAAEAQNAELTRQLASAEREYAALRLENGRVRSASVQAVGEAKDKDVKRRLGEIADAVNALADKKEPATSEEPTGRSDQARPAAARKRPAIERASPKIVTAGRSETESKGKRASDGRTLAERLRALQQPVARS